MKSSGDMEHQEVHSFNFSRAGVLSAEHVRMLRTVDEQFSRNLTHTLGAWFRTTVSVAPQSSEQMPFSQFTEKRASGFHVAAVTMQPLQVRTAMSLDLRLAPAMMDLLLGGTGRTEPLERDLTDIELAVLRSVLEVLLREWNSAWMPYGVAFVAETKGPGANGERLMGLQERVVCTEFTIALADTKGELSFCVPSSSLITALRAYSYLRDRQRDRTPEERALMEKRIGASKVSASLQFPAMRLAARYLRDLKVGALLPLPMANSVRAELMASGVPVLEARPMRSGEHRAAQIVCATEA